MVRITTVTRLESGYSARSGQLTCGPTAVPAPRPSIPDLIIAATAELAGLIVLDLDKNLDITAS